MTTNFISEQKLEKFARRISRIIGRRVDKIDYSSQLNISSGGLKITGTTSDLNVQITEKEKSRYKKKYAWRESANKSRSGTLNISSSTIALSLDYRLLSKMLGKM